MEENVGIFAGKCTAAYLFTSSLSSSSVAGFSASKSSLEDHFLF